MRRLAVVLFSAALLAFIGSPQHAAADGTTEGIEDINLAKMPLPPEALSVGTADYEMQNAGFPANPTPGIRQITLSYARVRGSEEPLVAGTSVAILESADAAHKHWEELKDSSSNNPTYQTFDVGGIADEAAGTTFSYDIEFFGNTFTLYATQLVLRDKTFVGFVSIVRTDNVFVENPVDELGQDLDARIQGVLAGKITTFPDRLRPDPNCNGFVDSTDALLVLQFDADLDVNMPCAPLGDANDDTSLTSADSAVILQLHAGMFTWPP